MVVVSVVVCEVVGVVQEEVALQEVEGLVMVCEEGMLFPVLGLCMVQLNSGATNSVLLKFAVGLCTQIFCLVKESSVHTHREEGKVEK